MMKNIIFYKPLGRIVLATIFANFCFANFALAQGASALDFPLQNKVNPNVLSNKNKAFGSLTLNARLTDNGKDLNNGMIWRIYQSVIGDDNKLQMVASSKGGQAQFDLRPGDYLIHASFGQAAIIRRVSIVDGEKHSEEMVLNAGGMKLNAIMREGKMNNTYLSFKIYSDDSENDDTALVIDDVSPDEIVRLKAGNYHIVSNYGTANAISRSDIRVDAGKTTEVTMQHHAGQITLKLLRQEGSEALADTSWSIATDSGDIVLETVGAYVSIILAEGDYVAVAKNKDQIYQKVFSVTSGHDENVDVIANAQNMQSFDDELD